MHLTIFISLFLGYYSSSSSSFSLPLLLSASKSPSFSSTSSPRSSSPLSPSSSSSSTTTPTTSLTPSSSGSTSFSSSASTTTKSTTTTPSSTTTTSTTSSTTSTATTSTTTTSSPTTTTTSLTPSSSGSTSSSFSSSSTSTATTSATTKSTTTSSATTSTTTSKATTTSSSSTTTSSTTSSTTSTSKTTTKSSTKTPSTTTTTSSATTTTTKSSTTTSSARITTTSTTTKSSTKTPSTPTTSATIPIPTSSSRITYSQPTTSTRPRSSSSAPPPNLPSCRLRCEGDSCILRDCYVRKIDRHLFSRYPHKSGKAPFTLSTCQHLSLINVMTSTVASSVFSGFSICHLKVLNCSVLEWVSEDMFKGMKRMDGLMVKRSWSVAKMLKEERFVSHLLDNLVYLDVDFNNSIVLGRNFFSLFKSLKSLSIANYEPKLTFLKSAKNLQNLKLANQPSSSLKCLKFRNIGTITGLVLSNIDDLYLEKSIFSYLWNLKHLHVFGYITGVHKNFLNLAFNLDFVAGARVYMLISILQEQVLSEKNQIKNDKPRYYEYDFNDYPESQVIENGIPDEIVQEFNETSDTSIPKVFISFQSIHDEANQEISTVTCTASATPPVHLITITKPDGELKIYYNFRRNPKFTVNLKETHDELKLERYYKCTAVSEDGIQSKSAYLKESGFDDIRQISDRAFKVFYCLCIVVCPTVLNLVLLPFYEYMSMNVEEV